MKNVLQCVGSIIYGSLYGVLMFLLFNWLTLSIMNLKLGTFIFLLIVGELIFVGVLNFVSTILIMPQLYLTKNNKAAKIVGILPIIISGILSIVGVWILNGDYKLSHWIIGISLTITIFISYIGTIVGLFKVETDNCY